MLNNLKAFFSTTLNDRSSTSSSMSYPLCIRTDGSLGTTSIKKCALYTNITELATDVNKFPQGSTFILSESKQDIFDDMYTFTDVITGLTPLTSSTLPKHTNEKICYISLVAQNKTMVDIRINCIGFIVYGILLDAFNVDEIVVKPNQTITFNYEM